MYAGEGEKQISALAQANQQFANEQLNKKMQALNLYNAMTATGDERRGSALKDATRSGIIGLGANVMDFIRGDNGNDRLKITNSLGMPQAGSVQGSKAPVGNPLIDAISKREYGGTDAVQGELLNRLLDTKSPDYNPDQYRFMVAQDQMGTGGVKGLMKGDINQTLYNEQNNKMKEQMQKSDYYKDVNAGIDKDVAKQNKQIEAQNLKAQKEFEAQERRDPVGGFMNYAKEKGLEIPTEFKGSKDEQRKQNYDLHNAQIEYFLSKGRRDLARKAESEWIQNEMNIDKSWGDDGKKNYSSLWNTSGPAKEATETIGIAGNYGDNPTRMPASNYTVPKNIIAQGKSAILSYINKQEKMKAGENYVPLTDAQITKAVTGDSKISAESVEYNKGVEDKLFAQAKTERDDKLGDIKVVNMGGVLKYRKVDPETGQVISAGILE